MRVTSALLRRTASAWVAVLLAAPSALAGECARPTDAGGGAGYDYGAVELNWFGNAQVLVWYTTQGEHAVSLASSRPDQVPDDVVTVAQVTSDALTRYAEMGFRAPLSDARWPNCGSNGGDGRFDVYLMNLRGADGVTVPESGRCTTGSPRQCACYLIAQSNYAPYYESGELGIRTVLPHETFHAVQNAYDAELERFWAEGSAQWAAETLDPALGDLERNLPAFFSQVTRSLDAPPGGATAAFLYGSAIWPVFLSQRYGDDIVRSILEQQARADDSAIAATDHVLETMQSSMADEFPLFAAWNAATGTRTGTGGYQNAIDYPEVALRELARGDSQAITSGLGSFYYHARAETPCQLSLATDGTHNRGLLVPFEDGLARVDRVTSLPAELNGEGIVVVSGITTSKKDAPFTLSMNEVPAVPSAPATIRSPQDARGCSLAGPTRSRCSPELLSLWLALVGAVSLSGSRARRAWSARAAAAVDTPSLSRR